MKKTNLELLIVDYKKGRITTSNGKTVSELHPLGRPIIMEVKRSWPPSVILEKDIKSRRITEFTKEHYKANAYMYLHNDYENDSSAFRGTEHFAVQFYKIKFQEVKR